MTHSTAKGASFGPHYTSTRDDLVHVERAGQHVETEKQSRFGLLADAYCPEKSEGSVEANGEDSLTDRLAAARARSWCRQRRGTAARQRTL
jgi:hypothetical protein